MIGAEAETGKRTIVVTAPGGTEETGTRSVIHVKDGGRVYYSSIVPETALVQGHDLLLLVVYV